MQKYPEIGKGVLVNLLIPLCRSDGIRVNEIDGEIIDTHNYGEFQSAVVYLSNGETIEVPKSQVKRVNHGRRIRI